MAYATSRSHPLGHSRSSDALVQRVELLLVDPALVPRLEASVSTEKTR